MARVPGAAERAVPAHPRGPCRRGPAAGHARVVVEKPFGTDLADAKALNELIARSFDEHHVFRIDHFLAKQTVLDILGLRFANRIFDPVWNSNHISRVDITWYESLGLEGRANYYDRAGALRDMIQNHLLQMLALVAMEPPRSITERDLRDRKVEVAAGGRSRRSPRRWRRRPAAPATPRAPSAGRSCPRTRTTRASTRTAAPRPTPRSPSAISNWRWAGTPFRLRTGKAIGKERREIAVHFKSVPHEPFDDRDRPNVLRFPLSPDAIALELNLNGEGDPFDLEQVTLDTEFPAQELPPYSLLLKEILEGDPTLSIRGDEAEELWRIVEPVLAGVGATTRCRWRSTRPGRAARRARRPHPGVARGGGRRQGTTRARADGAGTTLVRSPPRLHPAGLSSPPRSSAAARAGPEPGPRA